MNVLPGFRRKHQLIKQMSRTLPFGKPDLDEYTIMLGKRLCPEKNQTQLIPIGESTRLLVLYFTAPTSTHQKQSRKDESREISHKHHTENYNTPTEHYEANPF